MFTVEMDTDKGESCTIISLDQRGEHDDIEVMLFDDVVYLRQTDQNAEYCSLIAISPQQMFDIKTALDLPIGAYITKKKKGVTDV
jgi:hypothetical protein